MDSEEIPSCESMVTSVVPCCWYQPRCCFVFASHYFSSALWNKPALRKYRPVCCEQVSVKSVSVLRLTSENLNWDFPLKQLLFWLQFFLFIVVNHYRKKQLQTLEATALINNIRNILWEKAAGMSMKEEAGRKKEPLFEQNPFLKLELRGVRLCKLLVSPLGYRLKKISQCFQTS